MAEKSPGCAGTITMRAMPSSSARAQACSGPPPPNATSVKSRGSRPRSTVTMRSTLAIASSTSVTMPAAVASTVNRERAAPASRRRHAARAASIANAAAEQVMRIEPAEHDVRVGDGRAIRLAVARRARVGTRRERTDAQRAAVVDPRDRAAARTDFGQVDERKAHGIPAALHGASAVRSARQPRIRRRPARCRRRSSPAFAVVPPMSNESSRFALRARPSAAVAIAPLAGPLSTIAAGRVREPAARPPCRRRCASRRAARRCRRSLNARGKLFEVALDDRREHGVDDRRRASARIRGTPDRPRDDRVTRSVRAAPRSTHRRAPLVRVVCIGVQQADRNCCDVACAQLVANVLDRSRRRAARAPCRDSRYVRARSADLRARRAGAGARRTDYRLRCGSGGRFR